MAVRPSWVEISTSDGVERATGPKSRDGELTVKIYVRENGQSVLALEIFAIGSMSGKFVRLEVVDKLAKTTLLEKDFIQ